MRHRWLVSARFDLAAFGAPVALALALVALEPVLAPEGDVPPLAWLLAVLLVDVAHVWSTLFRTYLDPAARARHGALLAVTPVAAYAGGLALALAGWATFWTALAYLAVFHFVRQQTGWVALLARREPDRTRLDAVLDTLAVDLATVGPLVWWHAHLPRRFDWFLPGDFGRDLVPAWLPGPLLALEAATLLAFLARQLARARRTGALASAKLLVVLGTAATWAAGIVLTDSDWSFTATNVLAHGVPYLAVVWHLGVREAPAGPGRGVAAWILGGRRLWAFLGLVALLAYLEELGWDRLVWHEHAGLFPGPTAELGPDALALLLPLLALPQVVHYVLDGFIWRRDPAGAPRA